MADKRPFAGLATDDVMTAIVILLGQIAEKLPRTDVNDRVMTNGGEADQPINRVSNLGQNSRPADMIPMHMANAGSAYLYDQIKVSN